MLVWNSLMPAATVIYCSWLWFPNVSSWRSWKEVECLQGSRRQKPGASTAVCSKDLHPCPRLLGLFLLHCYLVRWAFLHKVFPFCFSLPGFHVFPKPPKWSDVIQSSREQCRHSSLGLNWRASRVFHHLPIEPNFLIQHIPVLRYPCFCFQLFLSSFLI